ncbi:hypothetical protein [Streptomyces boninensis]|uniref:hypothetical protein n=1 Tax=Streptomyces boninensis TaxID=2039455 RepID=UPI003B2136DF
MSAPQAPAEPAAADPIEAHVAELAAVLHGPPRQKDRMLAELREGLLDAAAEVAADAAPDLAPDVTADGEAAPGAQPLAAEAAREAVRQFGAITDLAPTFQRELTIAQARHTARGVLLAVPFLLPCWYVLATAAVSAAHQLPHLAQVLLAHLGGTAAATALAAAAFLAATGPLARRLPAADRADRLPLVVAWTGTTAAVALALSACTLTVASLLTANWPLSALAGAVTIACHSKIAASARACRQCARLPATA